MRALLTLGIACLTATSLCADIRYVDANLSTGANDGTSWANAYRGPLGLQTALFAAQAGDQLWVVQGTYLPAIDGNRFALFTLKTGVELYGGFQGTETALSQRSLLSHPTILSGDLAGNDNQNIRSDNAHRVVSGGDSDQTTILDGFIIEGGNCENGGLAVPAGGGYVSLTGAPRIRNCTFRHNTALSSGGAVYLAFDARGRFENCIFHNNSSLRGGAVDIYQAAPCEFVNCLFYANTTTGNQAATVFVTNTPVFLRQCTISENTALNGNIAGLTGGGTTTLQNSIVWNNHGSTIHADLYLANASYSCIGLGALGSGCFSADPLFLAPAQGDFRLSPVSPCIDAAANSAVPSGVVVDLGFAARFVDQYGMPNVGQGTGALVDMGAYEFQLSPHTPICAGDGTQFVPCPCAVGYEGRGCDNSSTGTAGALMGASGETVPDTIGLHAGGIPLGALSVFLSGTGAGIGTVFGDGVRCVEGTVRRLYVRSATNGTVRAPDLAAGELPVGLRTAQLGDPIVPGQIRYYQVWFRDGNPNFCPQGGSFNLSSGVLLHW